MVETHPDLAVLERILFGPDEEANWLLDNVDAGTFQSKATRSLFVLLSRHIPNGASEKSLAPIVEAEAPECVELFNRLRQNVYDNDSGTNALLDSLNAWAQITRFKKAVVTAERATAAGTPYAEVRSVLDRQLLAIDTASIASKPFDNKQDMAMRVQDYLTGESPGGLPFGFSKLDARVPPLMLGNLVIVAGRPGTGKSTDLRNWCRNWVKAGEPVAYFSFEMTGEEKLPLFACMDAGVSYLKYVRRQFNRDEKERFFGALEWWVNCKNFKLNERSSVTPEWILKTMKRYRAEGFTTLILDHLHRIHYTPTQKGDIRLPMGDFARQIKSFGVDNGCREVCGAQFTKGDKHEEPGDEMIREAAPIIDEADKIFLKWLPLVQGTKYGDGSFQPSIGEGGRRIFASEAGKGSDIGMDSTRSYLKIGKQRVRDGDGFVALPFNPITGLITESDDPLAIRLAS
jgi:hypothetical protein